jgi:Flp pilus assembly protein TadG
MALRFPACSPALRERAARVFRKLEVFRKHEGGNIAILAAFCIVMLVTFVGVAYDYSKATSLDTSFQNAADTGALHVAKLTEATRDAGNVPSPLDFQGAMESIVRANLDPGTQVTSTLTITADAITVRVCGDYINAFGALFGNATSTPCATATVNSSVAAAVPADIHLFVDTSESMGLAATPADRTRMKNRSQWAALRGDVSAPDGWCSFACHQPRRGTRVSLLSLAQEDRRGRPRCSTLGLPPAQALLCDDEGPVKLRIDVAREGATALLNEVETANGSSNTYRVSLSVFNDVFYEWKDVGRPLSDIRGALGGLALGRIGNRGLLSDALNTLPDSPGGVQAYVTWLRNRPGTHGRKQYVVLATDGVRSVVLGTPRAGTVRVFDQAECDRIKGLPDTKLAVIYMKYLDESSDPVWRDHVGDIYPNIESNLRSCASSLDLFVAGDSPAEIHEAFRSIVSKINSDNSPRRLTQ